MNFEYLKHFYFQIFDFNIRFDRKVCLPEHLASALRGGMAYIFKNSVCVKTIQSDCQQCLLLKKCLYPLIVESKDEKGRNIPRPYLIESPYMKKKTVEKITFSVVLFGKFVDALPYFIYSIIKFGEKGITANRLKFTLESVDQGELFGKKQVYADDKLSFKKNDISNLLELYLYDIPENFDNTLIVEFITPLRLKKNSGYTDAIQLVDLYRSCLSRITAISKHYCNYAIKTDFKYYFDLARRSGISENNSSWNDSFVRWSNRQKTKMMLGGITGTIKYSNVSPELLPVLRLGQFIHAGKSTVFGLGKFQVS